MLGGINNNIIMTKKHAVGILSPSLGGIKQENVER
jgi:hypothetical protein